MNINDLNLYPYWTDGKRVYKRESWCEHPTASFTEIESGDKLTGALHSRNLESLIPIKTITTIPPRHMSEIYPPQHLPGCMSSAGGPCDCNTKQKVNSDGPTYHTNEPDCEWPMAPCSCRDKSGAV